MTDRAVRRAYDDRAAEYVSLLGSIADLEAPDIARIEAWADGTSGPLLDAGCGPGHWTDHLARRGHDIEGVDLTPAFIAHATRTYPDLRFRTVPFDDLDAPDGSLGGILAWYSLIHHEPERIPDVLARFARALRPGGTLLAGFFTGDRLEPYAHRVTPAHLWPVDDLAARVEEAGFVVVDTETRARPGKPSHASLLARRSVDA